MKYIISKLWYKYKCLFINLFSSINMLIKLFIPTYIFIDEKKLIEVITF